MIRVGIDIGGTGIKVALVDENLQLIGEGTIPTRTDIPFEEQVEAIARCVTETAAAAGFRRKEDIASVGVGIPGIANADGEVIKCTNMGWFHMPFREVFRKYLDVPVFIDNDASSSVFITIGTGIGSGIILNGRIWSGAHGIGGELGHVILDLDGVPCTCGNRGCLERYCSATALIRMGREAVRDNPDSLILSSVGGDPSGIEARTVIDAAREGDPVAVRVYGEYISCLAQAVASVVNLLDPEVVVIGGGVSKAGDFLMDPLRKEYPKYVIFNDQPMPEIKLAVLGSRAGVIGAAMLS